MGGGTEAEQICFGYISLVNERAVLNPQSLHSLAKIFALVELPSNGGEYANDQAARISEMQCLCGKLKGAGSVLARPGCAIFSAPPAAGPSHYVLVTSRAT